MSVDTDPRQVIINYLSGNYISTDPAAGASKTVSRPVTRHGFGARADSFKFLKFRSIPGRELHACTFETRVTNETMHMICYLVQDAQGVWQFRGAAGGSGRGPEKSNPWVNIVGGGWPNDFFAGGVVHDRGMGVTNVRLVSANGITLDDTVEDGLVLFLTDQVVKLPLQAELYTVDGELVGGHVVFR